MDWDVNEVGEILMFIHMEPIQVILHDNALFGSVLEVDQKCVNR